MQSIKSDIVFSRVMLSVKTLCLCNRVNRVGVVAVVKTSAVVFTRLFWQACSAAGPSFLAFSGWTSFLSLQSTQDGVQHQLLIYNIY